MKVAPPRQAGPASSTLRKRKSAPIKIEEEDTPLHAKKIKTERSESTPSVHQRVVFPPPPQVVLPTPRHGPRRSVPNKGLPKQTVASAVSYILNLSPFFNTKFPIEDFLFSRRAPERKFQIQRQAPCLCTHVAYTSSKDKTPLSAKDIEVLSVKTLQKRATTLVSRSCTLFPFQSLILFLQEIKSLRTSKKGANPVDLSTFYD